jgi:hypothetical protein
MIACWDEYAACRLSAKFSSAETLDRYVQIFIGATKDARNRADGHIASYQAGGDLEEAIYAVAREYSNVLKFAAYVSGHLHGLEKRLEDNLEVAEFINGHWCRKYVDRLGVALSDLTTRYGAWKSIDEFDTIRDVADELFWESGLGMFYLPTGELQVGLFCRSDEAVDDGSVN